MNDQDRLILEEELAAGFRSLGFPELADDATYTEDTPDGRFLPDPRKRLVLMLQAFRRIVALEDANTFVEAQARIQAAVDDPPETVRIIRLNEQRGQPLDPIGFDLHPMTDIRRDIDRLMSDIMEDDGGPDSREGPMA